MDVTAVPQWRPTNSLERALRDAVNRADRDDAQAILGSAALLLPQPPGGLAEPAWPTGQADGRTFVIAFTSAAALRATVGTEAAHRSSLFADLADAWPDPAVWLAVNPGTSLALLLDADMVREAARRGEQLAFPVDARLRAALHAGDQAGYAQALLDADLALPMAPGCGPSTDLTDPEFGWWRSVTPDGGQSVVVYTSRERLRAELGDDAAYVTVSLVNLMSAWPEEVDALAVNPGSPIAGMISGEAVGGLRRWLDRAVTEAEKAAATVDPNLPPAQRLQAAEEAARAAVARLAREGAAPG
ncbi:SseB family protein [Luedemannella helvata]|uniref:SseB protein N-terminal domain-containing protein n=1 Tax=Luedemannella helvata TaxID=349315 RepID=A0ABN2JWM5_9ACTN